MFGKLLDCNVVSSGARAPLRGTPILFTLALAALAACALPGDGADAELESLEAEPAGELEGRSLGETLETTPAAWWLHTGQTAAQVSSLVSSTGGRIVSLQVESVSPLLFTVALVHNSGPHAKTWWWVHNQTSAQLASTVSSTGGRIVSLHPYVSGGQTLFAAVLIANSGGDAATWWWYPSISPAQLSTAYARLVDLNRYTAGGTTQLAAVAMSNGGAGARTWWWYTGVGGAQLGQLLTQNQAMLTNLEPTGDGSTFDAVMEQPPTPARWWWYFGQSSTRFAELLAQNGARPLDVKAYVSGGSRWFAGMMVNNSNAATTRVGDLLRNSSDGASGLYLKEVGGAVEAGLQAVRLRRLHPRRQQRRRGHQRDPRHQGRDAARADPRRARDLGGVHAVR